MNSRYDRKKRAADRVRSRRFHEKSLVGFVAFIAAALVVIFVLSLQKGERLESKVIGHVHYDSYVRTTYVMANKVLIPITNRHPESWCVRVISEYSLLDEPITEEIDVGKYRYDTLKVGDTF